jgi:hypothetical protein
MKLVNEEAIARAGLQSQRKKKTLPILSKVIIKCTVRYIVHLQCTFCMNVKDSDVLVWVRGQRKISQVLSAFGLLDFTMFRPVIA